MTTDGTTHAFPTELEAGRYHIVPDNQGAGEADLEFYQLPEGVTLDDLKASFEEASTSEAFTVPDFFLETLFNGGPWAFPGEVVPDLTPGEWVVNHTLYDLETGEQVDSPSAFTVTGEIPAVEELAGALDIGLVDMDFVAPDSFLAGPQVWRVQNNGLQVHHLVLACVPDGAPEDQVMELAAVFMGGPPAPRSCGRSTPRRRWICSSRCSSRRDSSTSMSSISRPAPTPCAASCPIRAARRT